MQHRATDYQTAQEVIVAVELAAQGSGAALIQRVSGFSSRWARDVVRRYGGVIARKPRNLYTWFDQDIYRLVHARYVIIQYECQSTRHSLGRQLLDAYRSYRAVAPNPGVLDINDFAQIVDLYQRGGAWIRPCIECRKPHLVVAERTRCPVCRFMSRIFCRGCHAPLNADRGAKLYCEACNPRSVRRALKRKAQRVELKVAGGFSEADPSSEPKPRPTPAWETTSVAFRAINSG